jgi:hypothetical protein
MTLKMIMA